MINKKSIVIILVIVFCFVFPTNVKAEEIEGPIYDISNLTVQNDTLTISGWAYMHYMDNGKKDINSNIEYAPVYTVSIVDENSNVATRKDGTKMEGTYYQSGSPSSNFSLTCILFEANGNYESQDCMDNDTPANINTRNQMINSTGNYYYDFVDFKISIKGISELIADTNYHLELKMKIKDYTSNSVKLGVFKDRIVNDDSAYVETTNVSEYVDVISEVALMQKSDMAYNKASAFFRNPACMFLHVDNGGTYRYLNKLSANYDMSNNGAVYYKYQLLVPDRGWQIYAGHDCYAGQNGFDYMENVGGYVAYAHAAWVQPTLDTVLNISVKNPCLYGTTKYKNAKDYAINNPGVCCYEYPETCCGNQSYIEELYSINPKHYLFSDQYCCKKSNTYVIANGYYNSSDNFNTFRYYMPNNELESYKYPFLRQPNSLRYYSASYIDNICEKSLFAGRVCKPDTKKVDSSVIYSMQYINQNETSNTIEHTISMFLDEKIDSKTFENNIAYSFFVNSDYEQYLLKTSGSAFKNIGYKKYALDNSHFEISIADAELKSNKKVDGKYEYKITFIIDITSTVGATLSPEGYYFLPVKLWYCSSETNKTCNNSTYFENNKPECCEQDPTLSGCDSNNEDKSYVWNNQSDCSTEKDSLFNLVEYNNGNIKTTEKIVFNSYPTLSDMKTTFIKAGTGFNYDIDNITHTVTNEGHYYSNSSGEVIRYCYSYNECNSIVNSIDNFYGRLLRNETTDINAIKNFTYEISGDNIDENYIISDIKPSSSVDLTDRIKIYIGIKNEEYGNYDYYIYSDKTYVSKITYKYTYSLKLNNKYISKTQNSNDDKNNIKTTVSTNERDNYIDGGNRYYTNLKSEPAIYNLNISLNGDYNKGLTGKLNSNENFTCQYRIDSGEKTNGTGDNGGNKNTYFRQISLTDPFPKNRKIGENWSGNVLHDLSNINESKVSAYITDKGNDVYSEEPMYQITLDASLISEIKKYNKSQNNKGEYYSWDGMQSKVWNELDSTSNFIDKFKDYIKFGPNLNRDTKVGDFK